MNERAQKLYINDTKLSLAERLDFAMTTIENLDAKIAWLNKSLGDAMTDIESTDEKLRLEHVENHRLRELLDAKVGSSIRVELPTKDNGWKCYVTCQREKDEEHLAEILTASLELLAKVAYDVKEFDLQTEIELKI